MRVGTWRSGGRQTSAARRLRRWWPAPSIPRLRRLAGYWRLGATHWARIARTSRGWCCRRWRAEPGGFGIDGGAGMHVAHRARSDQPALSSRHWKRAFLEGERGALPALWRLLLWLDLAGAPVRPVLPRRRPGPPVTPDPARP